MGYGWLGRAFFLALVILFIGSSVSSCIALDRCRCCKWCHWEGLKILAFFGSGPDLEALGSVSLRYIILVIIILIVLSQILILSNEYEVGKLGWWWVGNELGKSEDVIWELFLNIMLLFAEFWSACF
jgi:hypothetical protein